MLFFSVLQYSEWIAGIRGFQEMNLWITKLCCACRLERQDDEADSPPISGMFLFLMWFGGRGGLS